MKTSKFVQLDKKVLMEYIYEDTFLNKENYIITYDLNEKIYNFSAKNEEGSNNRYNNQLVLIDPITNKYGIKNTDNYNFLINKEYNQNLPIRYDRIKLHFPINYNFSDYAGCYLRVYVMDYKNESLINLSTYYFDKQDQDRFNKELELSTPPNTLNGKLWGKYIEISYPSPSEISLQRTNNITNLNSINHNISNGVGISNVSPIMIEFGFINKKETLNGITTFLLSSPYQTSVPQIPDFQNLSVMIEPSVDGDWFDIYGVYNGNLSEFNKWIMSSILSGKRYYVDYSITIFEENIKGKTLNILIDDDFNEKIEYRPIIKYSSTIASIEVIMKITDKVDGSIIQRRSSYGLLPTEISKYSRSLVRIMTNNKIIPKIYNTRNNQIYDYENNLTPNIINTIIKVPYPIITNVNNILAKSDSSLINTDDWKEFGLLKIIVNPFDNIFKFIIAKNIYISTSSDKKKDQIEYFDLSSSGTIINLYFKNHNTDVKLDLYRNTGEIDLKNGTVIFKLNKENVNNVREIYNSGINVFYITSTNEETSETTVIYEGTFIMSDSIEYINELSIDYQNENSDVQIIQDGSKEIAIITKRSVEK